MQTLLDLSGKNVSLDAFSSFTGYKILKKVVYLPPKRYIVEDELNGTEIVITREEMIGAMDGFMDFNIGSSYRNVSGYEAFKKIYDKKIKEKAKMQKDISDNL